MPSDPHLSEAPLAGAVPPHAASDGALQAENARLAALLARIGQQQQQMEQQRALEQSCVICLDQPKTHALAPCFHKCLCEACCSRDLPALCPICRAPVKSAIRIFD
jgi:hypothetical protein